MTLSEAFLNFKKSEKRLEVLQEYYIEGGELKQYNNYCECKRVEELDDLKEWNEFIRQSTEQGKIIERIRVLKNPVSSYLKYEIEHGFVPSQEYGQKVRFVSESIYKKLNKSAIKNEFWIFDDEVIFEMVYSKKGDFIKSCQVFGQEYIELYNRLFQISVPLESVSKQIRLSKLTLKI